jgi:hypothetical protein
MFARRGTESSYVEPVPVGANVGETELFFAEASVEIRCVDVLPAETAYVPASILTGGRVNGPKAIACSLTRRRPLPL